MPDFDRQAKPYELMEQAVALLDDNFRTFSDSFIDQIRNSFPTESIFSLFDNTRPEIWTAVETVMPNTFGKWILVELHKLWEQER